MRLPTNPLSHTAPAGNKNLRILENNRGRSIKPEFLFDMTGDISGDTLKIRGMPTGSGNRVIKLPFWSLSTQRAADGTRLSSGFQTLRIEDEIWTIDINTTALDTPNKTGGRLDGVALAPNTDYLVWALMNEKESSNEKLQGFGITTRPQAAGVVTTVGGGVGALGIFTTINKDAITFTKGARIVIRQGSAAGDAFNQGIVLAKATNSLTVLLDGTYGTINETNSSLAGLVDLEIFQLDSFEPYTKLPITGESTFPGGGVEFPFCYLGSLETDSASKIKSFRRRGDRVKIANVVANVSGNNVTVPPTTICLARWIPFNSNEVKLLAIVEIMAGQGDVNLAITTDADSPEDLILTSDAGSAGLRVTEFDSIIPRMRDCSINFQAIVSGGNPPFMFRYQINIYGHTGDQSW